MAFPTWLHPIEAEIINNLITAILDRDLRISVYDGEEYALSRSQDRALIQHETAQTDETTYVIRDEGGNHKGFFNLIHGNLDDVISDYSANELCDEIWNEVEV